MMTETKRKEQLAANMRAMRERKRQSWQRLGMGAAEFAAIINGMDKEKLALLRAMLEGARDAGEARETCLNLE